MTLTEREEKTQFVKYLYNTGAINSEQYSDFLRQIYGKVSSMIKFELDTIDNTYARFKAEFDPTPKSDDYTNGIYYFTMQVRKWHRLGKPVELLISVEGLITK